VTDFLAGRTISPEDSRALLEQSGRTLTAKWPGQCRACGQRIETGAPLACCRRWGWIHEACLIEAQEAAGA
jgi:hypothetical protein